MNEPRRALFFTWRTYGSWLPGDSRGWVDERRNGRGEPMNRPDPRLEAAAKGQMRSPPVVLSPVQRRIVDDALRGTCTANGWQLAALNVRTNHVHLILLGADYDKESLAVLKKEATKRLRHSGFFGAEAPVWARGGSRRPLVGEHSIATAVDYVLNRQ